MYMTRLVAPNDAMVYGRAIAVAHVRDVDDASPADIEKRPWKAKWPHYVRVHHAEFVDGSLRNGVSLAAMIAQLGPLIFEATKRNTAQGAGNRDPRRSLMQKPAMRLSDEGADLLDGLLEAAFLCQRSPQSGLAHFCEIQFARFGSQTFPSARRLCAQTLFRPSEFSNLPVI
jgi:hypothetical protein